MKGGGAPFFFASSSGLQRVAEVVGVGVVVVVVVVVGLAAGAAVVVEARVSE